MAVIKKSMDDILAQPHHLTEAERRRIAAMTEAEIEANALRDPDNPPWTDEDLARARRERDARLAADKRSA